MLIRQPWPIKTSPAKLVVIGVALSGQTISDGAWLLNIMSKTTQQ